MKKANAKEREALELYQEITENITVGIFVVRAADGVIVYVNPAIQRIFGYSPREIIGKHISVVNAPTEKDPDKIAKEIAQSLLVSGVWRGDVKNIKKDGAVFLSQAEISKFEHPQHGEVWVATHQDIMERKQVDAGLQESEERFRTLIMNSSVGLYRTSPDGKILLANPALVAMLGYSSFEELATRNLEEEGYGLGFERSDFRQHIEKAGEIKGLESSWIRKDGSTIFVRESVRVIRDNNANVLCYEGTVEDITGYIQADIKLQESEQRYRSMFKNQHAIMLLVNPDTGLIVDANPAACAYYGYSRAEITILHITDINTLSREQVAQEMRKAKSEERNHFFFKHRLKNGDIREVEVYSGPIEIAGQNLLYSIIHDITERKQVEKRLQDALALNQMILETSPVGMLTYHADGTCLTANPAAASTTGGNVEQLVGQNFREIESWKRSGLLEAAEEALQSKSAVKREIHVVTTFGKEVWYEAQFVPFNTEDETHLLLALYDLLEHKRMEEALRESERKFKNITENIPGVVYQFRTYNDLSTYYFSYVSPRSTELFGPPINTGPDWKLGELVHPDDRESFFASITQALENVKNWNYEGRFVLPTGETRWFQGISSQEKIGDELVSDGILLDITERVQAEALLHESEAKFRAVVEGSAQGILVHQNTKPLYVNKAFANILGYESPDEILEMDSVIPMMASYEHERLLSYHEARRKGLPAPEYYQYDALCKDGSIVTLQHAVTMINWNKEPAVLSAILDITEQKQAEESLRRREEEYKTLVEHTPDVITRFDRQYRHIFVNPAVEKEFGTTPASLLGKSHREAGQPPEMADWSEGIIRQVFERGEGVNFEIENPTPEGTKYYLSQGVPEFAEDGSVTSALFIHRNITELKQAEKALQEANKTLQSQLNQINDLHETLREQAICDSLTGLYNRRYLDDTIEREFSRAKRKDYLISIMVIDIDKFKEFNDSYGHDFGDKVLIALSTLLKNNIREGDIACRFGGDEFVVVLPDTRTEDAKRRAETLRDSFNVISFNPGGAKISATVSIGISIYPLHGDNVDAIFRCADSALYCAKQAGRNNVQVWRGVK